MQTIGERLEEARKRKGISIREASEATKIRSDYLAKFEGNNFDINLPGIYAKGFLRTYGNYLKVNTDKLLTDYAALGLGHARDSRRDSREFLGRIDLPETSSTGPVPDDQAVRDAAQAPRTAPPPRSGSSSSASSIGGDRGQFVKIGVIVGVALLAIIVLLLVVKLLSGPSVPSPAERPTTPAVQTPPASALDDAITLIALDNVRVKVTQKGDNRVIFDGSLIRNERRALLRQGPVWIEFDVARNLQVEKNGEKFNMDGRYTRNTVP